MSERHVRRLAAIRAELDYVALTVRDMVGRLELLDRELEEAEREVK